ncbi:Mitogen-activated protein kinase kinase kinase 17 [Vitis vinifera]|uniref:Mitogen-activated protein kinase kinase kinase 17 n=1 Tax=Vitis vinifera TaxID=29760 RepID=A0A438HG18_VITVI|nr:Mitogen-activated protein kinase kinase kinase 17 [Vitis vinifera]
MEDMIVKQCLIGQGASGKVYMAISRKGGGSRLLAVKSSVCSSSSSSLLREEEILRSLGACPDVVECFGSYSSMEVDGSWVYNLILEYAPGGTLRSLMERRRGKLSESEVRDYARMIIRGLCYIHQKGLVHCDLKPDNVLVFPGVDGGGNVVKIADFGLAKRVGEEEVPRVSFRGTPSYMSPESLALKEHDAPMDIWSLGCTIIEMVTGQRYGKDFLEKCFVRDPKWRWTAEMLLHHPFVAPPPPPTGTPILMTGLLSFRYCPLSDTGRKFSSSFPSLMGRSLTPLLPPVLLPPSSSSEELLPTISIPPTFFNSLPHSLPSSEEPSICELLSNLSLPSGWDSVEEVTPGSHSQ